MEDAFHAGRNALDRVAWVLNRKVSGKPGAVGKQEAVLRVLRCEDVGVWRDAFLEAGASGLKHRPRDAGDDEIDRLRGKVGEITMDNELLYGKIAKMEAGRPFGRRRSRRWVPSSRSPRARPAVYHGCAGSGV